MSDDSQPTPVQQTQPTPQEPPVNSPVSIKKIHSPFIKIFFVMLLLGIGAIYGYYLVTKQLPFQSLRVCTLEAKLCPDGSSVGRTGPNCEFSPCPTATIVSPTTNSTNLTIIPSVTQTTDVIPVENSLYLGTYNGNEAIFLTDKEKQKYYEPGGIAKTSPYIGELRMIAGGGYTPFDYKKLLNPRKIYSETTETIQEVNSFTLNDTKSIMYISLNNPIVGSSYPDLTNKIFQIQLSDLSSKEIWSNRLGADKYGKAKGAAYINHVVNDAYVTLTILNCYACEGAPAGMIILNITTKAEKYYEAIGDLQVNLQNHIFTYKKLAPFKEPCEAGPGCDSDGQRTVYKPDGQSYTDNLP
jgi:hypothetical protein